MKQKHTSVSLFAGWVDFLHQDPTKLRYYLPKRGGVYGRGLVFRLPTSWFEPRPELKRKSRFLDSTSTTNCWWKKIRDSPVDVVNIPLLTGFHACQVVQIFFHPQYPPSSIEYFTLKKWSPVDLLPWKTNISSEKIVAKENDPFLLQWPLLGDNR